MAHGSVAVPYCWDQCFVPHGTGAGLTEEGVCCWLTRLERHLGVRGRRHSLLNPRPSCRCASLSHCRCAAPSNSPCRHTNRVKKWWKQRPVSQCPSIDGRRNPSSWHFPTSSDRSYARFGVPGPSNRPSWNMLHWPSLYPGWRQSSPTTPCRLAALTPIVVDRSRPNCRC